MADSGFRLLIAGGKTGGHLFPGIAVAEAVKNLDPHAAILFVGTGSRFEIDALEPYGFDHSAIVSSGIKGKGILEKLKALASVPVSLVQAAWIIRGFRPDVVLGVGGYSSGPVVLTARLMGIKTALQEQNAIPGITNRILAHMVHTIFTAFEETSGFPVGGKVAWVGNPVRRVPVRTGIDLESVREPGEFTVLITGGSQGASSINRAVLEAISMLDNPQGFRFIHQTGKMDEESVALAYEALGLRARVKAFFQDMPRIQEQADLVICRAGAGTLSEITAKGKPSILIPFPYAADDHQRFNAMALVDQGAAVMILDRDLNGKILKQTLETLKNDPERLAAMAANAGRLSMPRAAETIASRCLDMGTCKGN
ncbi:MAG: undecaprenyldiphospho-muramoylpentapeptide beta-N-acetylglucosaminyltransferase [Pseudomonadota bacterium]